MQLEEVMRGVLNRAKRHEQCSDHQCETESTLLTLSVSMGICTYRVTKVIFRRAITKLETFDNSHSLPSQVSVMVVTLLEDCRIHFFGPLQALGPLYALVEEGSVDVRRHVAQIRIGAGEGVREMDKDQ